jgi:DNA-binding transcriptional regulator YdaS (Cro superfamily)
MNQYTAAFAQAMEATGTRNTAVVAHLANRVSPTDVSNWRVGRRPIPAEHAPAVAALLNIDPTSISAAYERMVVAGLSTASQGAKAITGHVSLDRLEDFGHIEGSARIVLPEFLVRPRIGPTPIASIRWTLQPSLAMAPEIKRNALILLDVTASQQAHVVDGGTYAYTLWGRPDVRRILIRRDAWLLAQFGNDSDHTFIPEADLEHLRILGAVVGWINPP